MFTEEQNKQLDGKLDQSKISQRSKGGVSLSYIEAWHAIAEANRIFGFDGWDRETIKLEKTYEGLNDKGLHEVGYLAKVKITVRANFIDDMVRETTIIQREGTGSGSQVAKSAPDAHEGAAKEAESDAMKRALMTFGNPFGLALYDKKQEGVEKPEKLTRQEKEPILYHQDPFEFKLLKNKDKDDWHKLAQSIYASIKVSPKDQVETWVNMNSGNMADLAREYPDGHKHISDLLFKRREEIAKGR